MILSELAAMVGGCVVGDGNYQIDGVAPLQNATSSQLTFLERSDRVPLLQRKSKAGAVLVPAGVEADGFNLIQVADVLKSFETIVRFFHPERPDTFEGVSEKASIHPTAKIGCNVAIAPFVSVGADCEIGDNVQIHGGVQIEPGCKIGSKTQIFANAVLYRNSEIGSKCIIHANAVIGAFGFGYDSSTGKHILSPQLGNVVIGDDVEIGANSTVDRATYGSTIIGDGTKIDNFVMVAHNCKIGCHNLICAHTGIAGSCTTGDGVVMAGRVGLKDHIHIGDGAVLGAMAGIIADVEAGARIVGIPATPEKEQMCMQIAMQKLPAMRKEFKILQRDVEDLKRQATSGE